MTILTKTGTEKKENEENKLKAAKAAAFAQVAVVDPSDVEEQSGENNPGSRASSLAWGDVPVDWYLAWRRRRLLTTLCGALLVLWILLAAIIGGVLLYRYLHRPHRYYGWCGTSYYDQERNRHNGAERLQGLIPLNERVEVDPDAEYEKIDVPRFGLRRPAVFVHDFKQNLTAIVDQMGMQCFIKNLDRRTVAPPKNFVDLIDKMETGYYEQNTAVIRERYRVRPVPLTHEDIQDLNSWMIAQQCNLKQTYMLDRKYRAEERFIRDKRNACKQLQFSFFSPNLEGGSRIVEYDLC